jgi:hypothetical protein
MNQFGEPEVNGGKSVLARINGLIALETTPTA